MNEQVEIVEPRKRRANYCEKHSSIDKPKECWKRGGLKPLVSLRPTTRGMRRAPMLTLMKLIQGMAQLAMNKIADLDYWEDVCTVTNYPEKPGKNKLK